MNHALVLALAALLPAAEGPAPDAPDVDEKLAAVVPADIVLRDETGKPATLGDLVDRPTILTLNYFRCAGICTPQLQGLQAVLDRISLQPEKDFRILTVSFDPRDTYDMAAKKRENYLRQMSRPFPPSAWRFLTGEAAATRRLADAVGFGFRAEPPRCPTCGKSYGAEAETCGACKVPLAKDYAHMAAIIFLSPERKVSRYVYGTAFQPADIEAAVLAAGRGEVVPTVPSVPSGYSPSAPFRLLCYSRDPASQSYVFDIKKTVGSGVVIGVGAFAVWLLFQGRAGRGKKEKSA